MKNMQKLISFDIGIKNMAFCLFDISNSQLNIEKWEILNLMNQVENTQQLCNCKLKGKSTKIISSSPKLCNKKAKYEKTGSYFCEKHAIEHPEFIIPNKEHSVSCLRKMKYDELLAIYDKYSKLIKKQTSCTLEAFCDPARELIETPPSTKKALLEKALSFFEENSFIVLQKPKNKTANETDLISIGRNMTRLLDNIPEILDNTITHVILENQISTIANRMKTIQGMLAQYFIMRGRSDIVIEFVSSSNKLKDFVAEKNTTYKQHKKDSIVICSQFLKNNPQLSKWSNVLETPKRDDLADSFLQGIWYLKRVNIISYAENLKINSV